MQGDYSVSFRLIPRACYYMQSVCVIEILKY